MDKLFYKERTGCCSHILKPYNETLGRLDGIYCLRDCVGRPLLFDARGIRVLARITKDAEVLVTS